VDVCVCKDWELAEMVVRVSANTRYDRHRGRVQSSGERNRNGESQTGCRDWAAKRKAGNRNRREQGPKLSARLCSPTGHEHEQQGERGFAGEIVVFVFVLSSPLPCRRVGGVALCPALSLSHTTHERTHKGRCRTAGISTYTAEEKQTHTSDACEDRHRICRWPFRRA